EMVDGIAARLARRLGPGAVGAAVGGLAVGLMPDPDGPGRRKALESALHGDVAALGPAVAWPEAAGSLRRAEAAFRLATQGRLATAGGGSASPRGQSSASTSGQSRSGLVVADDHLPALLLAAAPGIAADLARTRLA